MKIKSAEFVMSNSDVTKCPKGMIPEYAFIGRSNVGKTQLINHFIINKDWYLVDLPGYGYARVSKSTKKIFQKFITRYFEQREQLVCAFVLVDIRHKPQSIDLEFMQYLGQGGIPFCIVFTKADKLKPKAIDNHVKDYKTILLETWEDMPQYFITSSSKDIGKDDLLNFIGELNDNMIVDKH